MDLTGIPRERVPWYPSIDPALCVGDRKCLTFCAKGVFAWDAVREKPMVVQPYNCPVGCDGCTDICPSGAISFPSHEWLRDAVRQLRASHPVGAGDADAQPSEG